MPLYHPYHLRSRCKKHTIYICKADLCHFQSLKSCNCFLLTSSQFLLFVSRCHGMFLQPLPFRKQVDTRARSIAWAGDLKRFVNLDPEVRRKLPQLQCMACVSKCRTVDNYPKKPQKMLEFFPGWNFRLKFLGTNYVLVKNFKCPWFWDIFAFVLVWSYCTLGKHHGCKLPRTDWIKVGLQNARISRASRAKEFGKKSLKPMVETQDDPCRASFGMFWGSMPQLQVAESDSDVLLADRHKASKIRAGRISWELKSEVADITWFQLWCNFDIIWFHFPDPCLVALALRHTLNMWLLSYFPPVKCQQAPAFHLFNILDWRFVCGKGVPKPDSQAHVGLIWNDKTQLNM